MRYLKSFFFNFLVVFFADHILPGVDVVSQTKLPHIGGDLIFAIVLGGINMLIYPILKLVGQATFVKIGVFAIVLNFVAYAVVKFLPVGIQITSLEGYFLAAILVTIGSCLVNFLEMRHVKPNDQAPPSHSGEDCSSSHFES